MVNRKNDDILKILETGIKLRLLERTVLPELEVDQVVGEYFAGIRESYGGTRYMLRRGYRKYSDPMKSRIAAQFDGKNRDRLCERYGISKTTFYAIVRKFS